MQDFRTRRGGLKPARLALSVAGVIVLGTFAFVSLRGAWRMYDKLLSATDEEHTAKTQLAALTAQRDKVAAATAELSIPRGVEAEIRSRYGVARPGEGEIRIVPTESTSTLTVVREEGFLERLWRAVIVW